MSIPLPASYLGPTTRPDDLQAYYAITQPYHSFRSQVVSTHDEYVVRRIEVETGYGEVTIDYFQREDISDALIFVFPTLGGKNHFARHFADYFASRGIEAAIVHRSNEFKRPENYERLEEVFRENVLRDRIAIDVFEQEFEKKRFGSFGISRGAINASITAGVDERLAFNVFALGGSDLVSLFKDSGERGIKKYRRKVLKKQNITEDEFYAHLRQTLKTDPKYVAGHIDARNTLLFLSVFDESVPFEYGMRLRARIGNPRTVFLLSGHYTALAFTQFVKVVPPTEEFCVFPLDYVESEALDFYRNKLGSSDWSLRSHVINGIQAPFQFVADIIRMVVE